MVYTKDDPLYDKVDADSLPFVKFLKKLYDERTARDFYNYLGEMFDMTIDSLSIKTEMLHVVFENGQPAAGTDTHPIQLAVLDLADRAVDFEVELELAVFDDADLSTPAANATLGNASVGTIQAGSGTAALKIKTNAEGRCSLDLSDLVNEQVYLACKPTFGAQAISCKQRQSVIFS